MIRRLIRAITGPQAQPPSEAAIRRAVLDRQLEQALTHRRADRDARKRAALQREAEKRHLQFANDPLVRGRG